MKKMKKIFMDYIKSVDWVIFGILFVTLNTGLILGDVGFVLRHILFLNGVLFSFTIGAYTQWLLGSDTGIGPKFKKNKCQSELPGFKFTPTPPCDNITHEWLIQHQFLYSEVSADIKVYSKDGMTYRYYAGEEFGLRSVKLTTQKPVYLISEFIIFHRILTGSIS